MKIKSLLFPLVLASVLFTSCKRSKSESSYVQPYCKYPVTQYQHVYGAETFDKLWGFYDLDAWKSCTITYNGAAFTDLCTREKGGVEVRVVGNFMDVKAYMKLTETDSVEVPMKGKTLDSANNVYEFYGSINNIDFIPYFQHYPARMKPILYIKMPYDSPYRDYYYMIERLKKNLKSVEINPKGMTI
jgi:hypothetical protein